MRVMTVVAHPNPPYFTHAAANALTRSLAVDTLGYFLRHNPVANATWIEGKATGRINLRRAQIRLSKTSVAMAIYVGRILLGQGQHRTRDKERSVTPEEPKRLAELHAMLGISPEMRPEPAPELPGLTGQGRSGAT